MAQTSQHTLLNRYPGVKPFSIGEEFLFFGRQTDVEALNTLIYIKQAVVLYGKSGYGKSSLLNAGIIPKLKENNLWTYFTIRFNNYSEKETEQNLSPSQTLKQRLCANLETVRDNILDKLVPNEDSFWYWVKQHQLKSKANKFIFFFDQFEELFTYPKEQVEEFSELMADLLYSTVPLKFRKRILEADEKNQITDEEHDFFYERPEVKVVFSIRSDRLALLNGLTDRHPTILQHCYELNALNPTDARQAITEPAALSKEMGFATPSFSFTEKAIEKILNSVANPQDGKIETATLQIVCRYVEDTLVAVNKLSLIDEGSLGDIAGIFQQYYQGILDKLDPAEKTRAQHLIEDELIEGGKRNPLSANYIRAKFGLSENLLARLEQSSLLRKERDASGRILYEVSHDSLVVAIENVAQSRRKAEDDQKKARLEEQVLEERKKAEELQELNKKAVFRYKLAVGLLVFSLLIAGVALLFYIKSNKAANKAELAEKNALKNATMAEEEKDKANKAFFELKKGNDILKIRELMSAGKEFEGVSNRSRACQTYHDADTILVHYPEEESLINELRQNMKLVCGN